MALRISVLLFYICYLIFVKSNAYLISGNSGLVMSYPDGVSREHELPDCQEGNACNLIHKRFWLSPLVMRLCRCEDRSLCPAQWDEEQDNCTMFINPRAQFKFCSHVTDLPTCSKGTTALTTTRHNEEDRVKNVVNPKCYCPNYHYLLLTYYQVSNSNTTVELKYECEELGQCKTAQFCGHITTDLYQTYYVCNCPPNHLCLNQNAEKFYVREAMFEGYAYKGVCTPWEQ